MIVSFLGISLPAAISGADFDFLSWNIIGSYGKKQIECCNAPMQELHRSSRSWKGIENSARRVRDWGWFVPVCGQKNNARWGRRIQRTLFEPIDNREEDGCQSQTGALGGGVRWPVPDFKIVDSAANNRRNVEYHLCSERIARL